MTKIDIDNFTCEAECIYKNERYSARDNGAVLRHPRIDKPHRPSDNHWTFGTENSSNPYLHLGNARIHRIIATAFHGEPPNSTDVVDHIDTNCKNNRPKNLRWVTRLENALMNSITRKKIVSLCGSVEAFLENPSMLNSLYLGSNSWMRRVTPQEAQSCLERLHLWAESDKPISKTGSLGEWIFKPVYTKTNSQHTVTSDPDLILKEGSPLPSLQYASYPDLSPNLIMSKTPGAVQRNWRTPTEFPCCPQKEEQEPIVTYAKQLIPGSIFALNHFSTSIVIEVAVTDNDQSLYVMCQKKEENAIKPWSLGKITFEDGLYVHASIRTFFTSEGAEKELRRSCGLEWEGGDTFDDYLY